MDIKQKIKSVWNKISGKRKSDSELGADEVVHEEVFPSPKAKAKKSSQCKKPASKRTRPTNNNYQMIDPDDNTCDTGKS